MADGDHEAAAVVIDAAPAGDGAAVFGHAAGAEELRAGDLIAAVEIVDGVEDGVGVLKFHDLAVGEDAVEALGEDVPLLIAVEIVAHEEAAAEEEFAEEGGLGIGEIPVADFDAVEPGPVVLEAFVEIDGLFDGAGVDAGEAAEGLGEVAVAAGIVHGPIDAAAALGPIAGAAEAATAEASAAAATTEGIGGVGVHEAGEGPLGLFLIVGRDGEIVVLEGGVFAPRLLRGDDA